MTIKASVRTTYPPNWWETPAQGSIPLNNQEFLNGYEGMRSLLDKGRLFLPLDYSSWDSALVGSGAYSNRSSSQEVRSGTTASSTAKVSLAAAGLNAASAGRNLINWSKKLLIAFTLWKLNSDAEATGYVQLKESNAIGNLAAKGLGIVIANLTLSGESYGTERGTTTATQAMTNGYPYSVLIVFDPATPSCSWYINGTLLETVTTAAKLPTGGAGADDFLVVSIQNGATGGVNNEFGVGYFMIFQAQ